MAIPRGPFDIIFQVTLVRSSHPHGDDIDDLRSRVAELAGLLDEAVAELSRAKSDLAAFGLRYRQDVGLLHEQLDELERAIAEAELGELSRRVEGDTSEPATPPAAAESEPQPRYTSDAVRKLFRDVAKTI